MSSCQIVVIYICLFIYLQSANSLYIYMFIYSFIYIRAVGRRLPVTCEHFDMLSTTVNKFKLLR